MSKLLFLGAIKLTYVKNLVFPSGSIELDEKGEKKQQKGVNKEGD